MTILSNFLYLYLYKSNLSLRGSLMTSLQTTGWQTHAVYGKAVLFWCSRGSSKTVSKTNVKTVRETREFCKILHLPTVLIPIALMSFHFLFLFNVQYFPENVELTPNTKYALTFSNDLIESVMYGNACSSCYSWSQTKRPNARFTS